MAKICHANADNGVASPSGGRQDTSSGAGELYDGRMPRSATAATSGVGTQRADAGWTFLTNHGHVLVCIAQDPDVLLSEIAERVGIRERAAHRIVTELVDAGYVRRERVGRRNHYTIDPDRPLRHPLEREHIIGELLSAIAPTEWPAGGRPVAGGLAP